MNIRIELERRILVKQGRGRNRVNAFVITFEQSLDEALAWIDAYRNDPDTCSVPFLQASLYDQNAFSADPLNAQPFKVVRS